MSRYPQQDEPKPCRFVPAALREMRTMPVAVQKILGRAIKAVQFGETPDSAKPLHGYGSGVLEIVEDFDTGTYRAVYTVRFRNMVYVLHVFQKKSTHGVRTPRHDLELIRERLRWAEADYAGELLGKEE